MCVRVGGVVAASGSRIRIKHTWTAAARWFGPCFWNNELQKRKEKHKKIASNGACYSDRRSELCAAQERLDGDASVWLPVLYANEETTDRVHERASEWMETARQAREKANGPAGALYAANPSPAERGDGLCL